MNDEPILAYRAGADSDGSVTITEFYSHPGRSLLGVEARTRLEALNRLLANIRVHKRECLREAADWSLRESSVIEYRARTELR